MKVISYGRTYSVRLCFTRLLFCNENVVVFRISYYSSTGVKVRRKIVKQLDEETFRII